MRVHKVKSRQLTIKNHDGTMHKETVYSTKPFKIGLTDEVIASNSGFAMAGIKVE